MEEREVEERENQVRSVRDLMLSQSATMWITWIASGLH